MRKAPSPLSLCALQNGSAHSGSLRLLHGRPVLLWEGGWGRIHGSEGRRYDLGFSKGSLRES